MAQRFYRNPILFAGLILYFGAFAVLLHIKTFDRGGAIAVLLIFGIALPIVGWLTTMRRRPLPVPIQPGKWELFVLFAYIVLVSLYLLGGPQWIDHHLPGSWIASARIKFVVSLVRKLIVFVVVPFAIFRMAFNRRPSDFGLQSARARALARADLPVVIAMSVAFLAFQYFLSGGGAQFRQQHFTTFQLAVGMPLCFAWLLIEVGLVEEFFFRALVQTEATAALKSEISGIVVMCLVFGLAHAPGLVFRNAGEIEGLGSHPSLLEGIAYSIVVLAVSGISFGVIWSRTKNLYALMILHAAGDLLPNFGAFVKTWL